MGGAPQAGADVPGAVQNRPQYPEVDNTRIFECKSSDHGFSAARLWRLTSSQFVNTVATFLTPDGIQDFDKTDATDDKHNAEYFPHLWVEIAGVFEATASPDRFTTYSDGISMAIEDVQDALASTQLAGDGSVDYNHSTCVGSTDLHGCLSEAIRTRGRVAFRRPLTNDEVEQYTKIATDNVQTLGEAQAIGTAYQALLMSPNMLFRVEAGAGDPDANGLYTLSPQEVAASLAYTFMDGPPDKPLMAAADDGSILKPDVLKSQIARLLGDGTHRPPMVRFFEQYFHYDRAAQVFKDTNVHPEANPGYFVQDTDFMVRDSLQLHGSAGFFSNLMTRADGFYNHWYSAAVYGFTSNYDGSWYKSEYPAGTRIGILSQPSWLSTYSKMDENEPVQRGRFVNESLLCRSVPPLPIGFVPQLPDLGPNATLRDRLAAHSKGTCLGCHANMDPIGLGFEQWDNVGNYRTTESGRPVDSSGTLSGTGDQDGPYANAAELITRLSKSATVQKCMIRHNFRYYLGRPELESDACSMRAAWDAFSTGQDYFGALTAFFTSDSFLKRSRK
jgi:hypothetical protein